MIRDRQQLRKGEKVMSETNLKSRPKNDVATHHDDGG